MCKVLAKAAGFFPNIFFFQFLDFRNYEKHWTAFPNGILKVEIFAPTKEWISCVTVRTLGLKYFWPDISNISRHTFLNLAKALLM